MTNHELMGKYFCPNGHPFAAQRAIHCNECNASVVVVPMSALIEVLDQLEVIRGGLEDQSDSSD